MSDQREVPENERKAVEFLTETALLGIPVLAISTDYLAKKYGLNRGQTYLIRKDVISLNIQPRSDLSQSFGQNDPGSSSVASEDGDDQGSTVRRTTVVRNGVSIIVVGEFESGKFKDAVKAVGEAMNIAKNRQHPLFPKEVRREHAIRSAPRSIVPTRLRIPRSIVAGAAIVLVIMGVVFFSPIPITSFFTSQALSGIAIAIPVIGFALYFVRRALKIRRLKSQPLEEDGEATSESTST